jgi:hypothetical protein
MEAYCVIFWQPRRALKPGRYDYYIEVNKSFDQNEYHDYSWYRGQPCVIWHGSLQIGNRISRARPQSSATVMSLGPTARLMPICRR